MNYIGTQNFETKRCILRRIKLSDYTMMYENWAKYDEVCRYYPFNPVDDIEIYRDKVKHWISNYESDSYFHWVIESARGRNKNINIQELKSISNLA